MTDKEFKRLSRAQLIEIIYQLQLKEEEMIAENQKLKAELEDKRIRMQEAGNIAEAVLQINKVMQTAQNAAEQYLEEISAMRDETANARQSVFADAQQEVAQIVAEAQQKAAQIIAEAQQESSGIAADAQQEASQIIAEAQQEAAQILEQVQQEAAILERAQKEAEAIITKAQKESETIIMKAQKEAETITTKAQNEADTVLEQARQEAEIIAEQAQDPDVADDSAIEAILAEFRIDR